MNLKEFFTKNFGKKKSSIPEIPKIKYGVPVKMIKLRPMEAITVCVWIDKINSQPELYDPYLMMWKYLINLYPDLENAEPGCSWKIFVIDSPINIEIRLMKENIEVREINNLPILIDMNLKKK